MDESENARFTEFLREKAAEAKKDLGYSPTEFLRMLSSYGGYQTVSRLIAEKHPSSGFETLWEHRRLDLTVEALVVETHWRRFFDGTLLQRAEARLKSAGYTVRLPGESSQTDRLPAATLSRATPEYIWRAVQQFIAGEVAHSFGPSTDYDLIADDGLRLPPKAVFGVALSMALGGVEIEPKHFTGGDSSTCFRLLRAAGFEIVSKGQPGTERDSEVDAIEGWTEGKAKLVAHVKRERAYGLSRAKKAQHIRLHGRLFCERCKLDPIDSYKKEEAEACIEVHHASMHVSAMSEGHITTLDDLQCLCANCHRLVHALLRAGHD
jgi:hypothetical protein